MSHPGAYSGGIFGSGHFLFCYVSLEGGSEVAVVVLLYETNVEPDRHQYCKQFEGMGKGQES